MAMIDYFLAFFMGFFGKRYGLRKDCIDMDKILVVIFI